MAREPLGGRRIGRRRLLGASLGALLGAVTARGSSAAAAVDQPPTDQLPPGARPFLLGVGNEADAPTTLRLHGDGAASIFIGQGVVTTTATLTSDARPVGVVGMSGAIGVLGTGGATQAEPFDLAGPDIVAGVVGSADGVVNVTVTGIAAGVIGTSHAIGVLGSSGPIVEATPITTATGKSIGVVGTGEGLGVLGASNNVGVLGTGGGGSAIAPTMSAVVAGVVGTSDAIGVLGTAGIGLGANTVTVTAGATGVVGSADGLGVLGRSNRIGVFGAGGGSTPTVTAVAAGVVGTSDAIGVLGATGGSIAATLTAQAAGVIGVAGGTAVGVLAGNVGDGFALDVAGRSRFSTGGRARIPARRRAFTVPNPVVTAQSLITVTLMSQPSEDGGVLWVERLPGAGFVVHLKEASRSPVELAYLIVEPSSA